MERPDQQSLLAALDATWPPAKVWEDGPLRHADGQGGGKRVSATRLTGQLEDAAAALATTPLIQVPDGADALEGHLAATHDPVDPTAFFAIKAQTIAARHPEIYLADAPVAAMRRIWAEDGVGPARLAVMDRVRGPKTCLLARDAGCVAGVAFVAAAGDIAMLHALYVPKYARRKGLAGRMTRAAADWALSHGAPTLALAVVRANAPAIALYEGLGMTPAGGYHYRALKQDWA